MYFLIFKFHNTVKESESGRPADIFNHKLNEIEELLQKHNQSRQTVLDSFKTVYAENIRLMDKIKQQVKICFLNCIFVFTVLRFIYT